MDITTIREKLEKHSDLSDAMITHMNRYLVVINKIIVNTQNIQNVLMQIYAYNPEAMVALEGLFTNYFRSLEEQAEAVMNFAGSFENIATFWHDLLMSLKSEVLDD